MGIGKLFVMMIAASLVIGSPATAGHAASTGDVSVRTNADGYVSSVGKLRSPWRLSSAIKLFGKPSKRKAIGPLKEGCIVTWKKQAITAGFANFGDRKGRTACHPRVGLMQTIKTTNPRFVTALGVRVGNTEAQLVAAYPDATRNGNYWSLAETECVIGSCPDPLTPTIEAKVSNGIISSIGFITLGAGD